MVAVGDGPGAPLVDPRRAAAELGVEAEALLLGWYVDEPAWLDGPTGVPTRTYMAAYGLSRATREGWVEPLPVRLGAMPALVTDTWRAAVAVVSGVRRGDGFAFTENVGIADTMARAADQVVVQLQDDADDVGGPVIEGTIAKVVTGGARATAPAPRVPGPVERRIAEQVAALIPERATLQFGIGAVPESVVAAVASPVSIVSGLVTDALVDLDRRGLLLGEALASYVWGGGELVDLVRSGRLRVVGIAELHGGARRPAATERFVSINAGIQVGLDGSANVERLGGRQVAGIGGHADFSYGATQSPGGISVVTLASTHRGRSNIVPSVEVVTTARADVSVVVTEHGVADLRGLTDGERRLAMVEIAAPEHRAELTAAIRT